MKNISSCVWCTTRTPYCFHCIKWIKGLFQYDSRFSTINDSFVSIPMRSSKINQQANLIAQRTRRGAGNYAVVSSEALTILQSATTSAFARSTEGVFEAPTNTKFVGTLNNSMRVYVDGYASTGTDVLVGYKGSSEADAPAFYCPYIPLMSSGVVLDPSTFEPVVSFLTRYGYVELSNTASSLGNAADYLARISISNVSFK